MTFILDRLDSPTWPFDTPMDGFPTTLFCDANIVSADRCVVTSVLVGNGVVYVQATSYLNNNPVTLHSNATGLERGGKVYLYDDDDNCFGWLLMGWPLPEAYTADGISRELCRSTCTPFGEVQSVNPSGMTGDWMVEGLDGIEVTHENSGGTMVIKFDTDESYFNVPSGDEVDYGNGIGIYAINNQPGPTVAFDMDGNGDMFAVTATEDGEEVLKEIVLIPDMFLEYPYSPPGTDPTEVVDREVRTIQFSGPTLIGGDINHIRWSGWYLQYEGAFLVSTPEFGGYVDLNAYPTGIYGPSLYIKWPACVRRDYVRSIIKTSTEDGSSIPYPLDKVLNDDGSGN